MTADVEFGAINPPAVTWRHVTKSLRIKLPSQGADAKSTHRIGDDLGAPIISTQRSFIVLMDEDLKRVEHDENSLLTNFAATSDSIFLRAHVQEGVAHQLFPADQYASRLRATDVLTAAEGDHVKAEGGILPEALDRRDVSRGIVESIEVMLFGNGDGFRAADFAFVRQNIGEMDGYCFRVDGGNHLFARLNLYQLRAGLADLVVERVAMAFLDDD